MKFVLVTISLFIFMDAVAWRELDRALRKLLWPKIPRILLGIFMGAIIAFMTASLLSFHLTAHWHELLPRSFSSTVYIWHFIVLPITLIGLGIGSRFKRKRPVKVEAETKPDFVPSRRRFLTAAAVAIPPLATFSLSGIALSQIGKFRVRKFSLAYPNLPRRLDGFSMAVVADIHTGVFTTPKMLGDICDCTNNLRSDMILLAGDLVNISHADLPEALDMVNKLDAPAGVYMVQGNHDVIESPMQFNSMCAGRGVRVLLDEAMTIRYRGEPFQLLGTLWRSSAKDLAASVNTVADARDPDLFPILLSHHPHSWDAAAARGLPLTISGHTHGGQIMFTDKIGAGPLRFKYWTGLYSRPGTNLIVSNGVGNWFPLRVNAPAEILHITLRSA